jgi:tRNA threonylcarbamoyladenosine biosynthesis protein TsaB
MNVSILQINTALSEASVSICTNGELIGERINPSQQEHAGFLQPAIASLCEELQLQLKELQAVAVVNGPGSYTGLRVGLSAAKGICYALDLPLILINTLEWMAYGNRTHGSDWVCPMIDARRMEVFTSVYDQNLNPMMDPRAMILEANSMDELLTAHTISFIGNGATKWKEICKHPHAHFPNPHFDASALAKLTQQYYQKKEFADLAYSEPFYTKEFHSKK